MPSSRRTSRRRWWLFGGGALLGLLAAFIAPGTVGYLRAVTFAILLFAGPWLAGSCTCSDRVLGEPPQGYGEPACLWLINPRAFRADGGDWANGKPPEFTCY